MMQTLAGVAVTWGWFGASLERYQVVAAVVLIGAVAMVQRAQEATALPPPPSAEPPPPIPEARVV
jgi:drug/metabolite transporter (DMT)-like permease